MSGGIRLGCYLNVFRLRLMKACCLVLADGRLTFYKLLSACFQKPTVSHCHRNILWVWYRSRLTVMYFCLFRSFCPFDFLLLSPLFSFPCFRPACHAIAISSRKSKCLSLPQGRGLFLRLSRFSALSKTPAWTFPAGPRMQPSAGRGCWG